MRVSACNESSYKKDQCIILKYKQFELHQPPRLNNTFKAKSQLQRQNQLCSNMLRIISPPKMEPKNIKKKKIVRRIKLGQEVEINRP